MGLNLSGITRILGIGLLLGLLSACGGGSGGGDSFTGGGFVGREEIKVNISADQTTLPPSLNEFIPFPNPARDPHTTVLTVTVTQEDRPFTLTDSVLSLAITGGLRHGSLVCPEVEGEEGPCTNFGENAAGDEVPTNQFRYRAVASDADEGPVVGLNSGVFQFFFVAEGDPDGTAVITASVFDPNTQQNVSDSVQIRVTEGVSTGLPAQIGFDPDPAPPLYITGQGLFESLPFRVEVFDDALEPVDNPGGRNNVVLQILPTSPNGGETLTVIDANGQTQTGRTVAGRTLNGLLQATFTSGTLPGTALIAATADRFDNNVDNGIQDAVTDVYQVAISNGQVRTLTFTGPFVELIDDNENVLTSPNVGDLNNNIYTIPLSVLAIDQFGNPPPDGTQITFRVVDSPLAGFPDDGRGEFLIQGEDGNIQEGGVLFTTPPGGSTFIGAQPNCQLVYEGFPPDQEGGRIITSVDTQRQLTVNTPFNPAPDTGFTVPYVVGCPPHAGSVGQLGSGRAVAFTDQNGLATVDLIYDATQLGRRFKVVAEAAGGQAGAVLSYWYLGFGTAILALLDENGEFIDDTITAPDPFELVIPPGDEFEESYIVRLTDQNGLPLPAQMLSIDASIFDPDAELVAEREQELLAAEANLTAAETALETFRQEYGDICGVVIGPIVGADCPVADLVNEPLPPEISCAEVEVPVDPPTDPPTFTVELLVDNNALLGQNCPFELTQSDIFTCSEADSFECTTFGPVEQELQQALFDAQQAVTAAESALAAAQALDDEFDPMVFVDVGDGFVEIPNDEDPVTVLTGGNGEAPITLRVEDLPPQRVTVDADGNAVPGEIPTASVFITTVGPDPQAPTLQIDFTSASEDTGG